MAKEKLVDLAPKAEKITDEQLKDLQGIIGQVNQAQLSVGQLETQKAGIMAGIGDLQMKLKSMQDSLEEEYGKVTVNIQDGTIKELEDAPDTKD
jgi:hypothetical protein|tara:strand:- start:1379 stop:1660 length:282 start_codon:yes stop_codon:yes gene_type:complete